MRLKRSVLAAGFTVGAIVLMAGSAWAWCTPTGSFVGRLSWVTADPTSAPAGTRVVVNGGNWAKGRVDVHLGSAAGRVVGTGWVSADWAPFSVEATIPEGTTPGKTALVVVVSAANGASQIPTGFLVTASSPPSGTIVGPGDPGATETSSNVQAPRPPVAATDQPAPTPSSAAAASAEGANAPGAVAASPAAAGASSPAPGPVASAVPSARRAATAPAVNGGPSAAVGRGSPTTAAAPGEQASGPVPSVRSANGDLWRGFANGGGPVAPTGLIEASQTDRQGAPGQVMATILLVSGVVALLGGFALAELRRRPLLAASGR